MTKVEWRIYYSNGTTFSNRDGEWEAAPPLGVVCVVTLDPTKVWGRFVLHNHELYYKVPDREVMVSEEMPLLQSHVPAIQDDQIKRGGNAWQEEWVEIMQRATADEDFPKSSPRRRATDWKGDPREPKY